MEEYTITKSTDDKYIGYTFHMHLGNLKNSDSQKKPYL